MREGNTTAVAKDPACRYLNQEGWCRGQFAANSMHSGGAMPARLAGRRFILQNSSFIQRLWRTPIRRPNRAPPVAAKDGPRTNDEIRNAQIQLIDQDGTNKGVVETIVAVKMASRRDTC